VSAKCQEIQGYNSNDARCEPFQSATLLETTVHSTIRVICTCDQCDSAFCALLSFQPQTHSIGDENQIDTVSSVFFLRWCCLTKLNSFASKEHDSHPKSGHVNQSTNDFWNSRGLNFAGQHNNVNQNIAMTLWSGCFQEQNKSSFT